MATLQNIGKLKYRGEDGQWHPLPVVVQDADGSVSTISGKGAPTSSTRGEVNQLYRDEDTQKLYICTATDGGYTWAAVSGGSVDVDATLTKAGYAADAKAAGDAIERKIDKAQGVENAGKVLGVGEDGNVAPGDPSYLPGFVSYIRAQGLTYDQQAIAKANIGAGTLRNVYYWKANGTLENPNGVMTCAINGDTCICGGVGDSLPDGMKAPVLVIYGSIDRGYRDATAFDGSNATWTFTVKLSDYSYSTPIKKSGIPNPATAQVGQIVKVKAVDADGKITETETVDMPGGGTYTLPIASPNVLGGVKPIAKTDAMTQGVGVDAEGALWTAAGGDSYELLVDQPALTEDVYKCDFDVPNLRKYIVIVSLVNTSATAGKRALQVMLNGNNKYKAITSSGSVIDTSGKRSAFFEIEITQNRCYSIVLSNMNSDGIVDGIVENINAINMCVCGAPENGVQKLTVTNLNANTSYFLGAGTRIKIYGVKA